MRVNALSLEDFRNYTRAEVSFDESINIISGDNAQGKTNLLEAIYLLSGAKSFRVRSDKELIRFGALSALIRAETVSGDRKKQTKILLAQGRPRRTEINGVKKSSSELVGEFTAVLFCPDDLLLIRDGPAARRRLMDAAIGQLRPSYAEALKRFSRLYESKTRILRDWREKPSLLEALDDFSEELCRCSAVLIRHRAAFAKKLQEKASAIHREFSGGEALTISYRTVSTVTDPLAPMATLYQQLMAHQTSHRTAEIEAGLCLSGAHKDDLEIAIGGVSARSFASQGQTRTAALSLKLAEREIFFDDTGEWPVLLLDDVLSELDAHRQSFILNRIRGGQTLITCCEDETIAEKTRGRVIKIKGGEVCTSI